MKNFALIGAGGYIAPRHIMAIKDNGCQLVAASDPRDAVGVLDRHFLDVKYFAEIERLDRFLEKRRRMSEEERIHYVTVCSPNYLHDAHVRLGLRVGADVICEKPLVINPWNLDQLEEIERESSGKINTILQLRVHPDLVALKEKLSQKSDKRHQVELTYISARGPWYDISWKGIEERSGGVAMNIGVHFFDLLLWLFGGMNRSEVYIKDPRRMSGYLELQNADVRWFLSVNGEDLPFAAEPGVKTTHRVISVDGEAIEFSGAFADLHTLVYQRTLEGKGFGIEDARPAVELVHQIRTGTVGAPGEMSHPMASS